MAVSAEMEEEEERARQTGPRGRVMAPGGLGAGRERGRSLWSWPAGKTKLRGTELVERPAHRRLHVA